MSVLRRRRWSLAWLLPIVGLGIGLAWLASVPLLRGEPDGRIGSRVGEVNVWATSCEPCRTGVPAVQRLAEVYPDDLLILAVDWARAAMPSRTSWRATVSSTRSCSTRAWRPTTR